MKSIIISCTPKECEQIANGNMSVLVRKTAPKETPFKAYVYCTKTRKQSDFMTKSEQFGYVNAQEYVFCNRDNRYNANGKVIGEFICDKIYILRYQPVFQDYDFTEIYKDNNINDYFSLKKTCLTQSEICEYGKGKTIYALHISDRKIYDEPRELSEFSTRKLVYNGLCGKTYKPIKIDKAPATWCYAEELEGL